jgi:polysaccharide deacetylase family protein (PEP-CTERM system associated)
MTAPRWELLDRSVPFEPVHAATVDVEEHFHAAALALAAPRASWRDLESRVVANTERTLAMFAETGASGTFFILGSVAERFPGLVRAIAEQGHEIASHGHDHWRATEQRRDEFWDDVRRSKEVLEDVSGRPVLGYRAANFSIGRENWWAFEVLAEVGYRYSSSVYPVRHDHYGMLEAPRTPFAPLAGFVEIPISTLRVLGQPMPAGGGGYFRLLPYPVSRYAITRIAAEGRNAIHYFHPWEIDPDQPRFSLPLRSRFRHYTGLRNMEAKLRRLLADFTWRRADHVFRDLIAGTGAGT